MEYFILETKKTSENCTIDESPEPLDSEQWRIAKGERMGEHYSPTVQLQMDKQHKGLGTPDFIHNTLHLPMVSKKLRALLETEADAEIEYLQFSLLNHKGRPVEQEFYIANIIGTQDCVDRVKTEARESALKPGKYSGLFKLLLDQSRIDPKSKLFRISAKPTVLIIRSDLRAVLEHNGITGMRFIAMGEECMIY